MQRLGILRAWTILTPTRSLFARYAGHLLRCHRHSLSSYRFLSRYSAGSLTEPTTRLSMAAADISTAMPTLQNGMTLYPSSTSMNGNGHLCQNGQVATEGSSRASPVPAEEALASTSSSADTVSQNGSHGSVQSDAVDTLKAPSAKRIKLAHKLNYRKGLFLAPMVSIVVLLFVTSGLMTWASMIRLDRFAAALCLHGSCRSITEQA